MMLLFIKLVLAHIIGDFLLQPGSWVNDKKEKKHRSPYLYLHGLVHTISLVVVLQFNSAYWLAVMIIVISHLLIDMVKLNLSGKINSIILFFSDQLAHLLVIIGVTGIYVDFDINELITVSQIEIFLFITAILTVTNVSGVIIKEIIARWDLREDSSEDSLENAGKYIGMLERLFVFAFVVTNHWQAIGFLLAAKSVFRFGDLSKSKDRKLTEYILIGTLLSFGLAITTALGYLHLAKLLSK